MRIAFLLPAAVISGGVFIVYEHARRLHLKGHDVRIVYSRGKRKIDSYPGMEEIPITELKDRLETEMDVVIATWWETAYDAERLPGKRYAYFIQGDERNFYPEWLKLPRRLVVDSYGFGYKLFATTSALKGLVEELCHRTCTVVPCAIDVDRFRSTSPRYAPGSRIRVLVEGAGSLPHKRIDFTFSVLREFPDVEVFYISGDGYCDTTWRADRVFRKLQYEQMPGIMASCDVLMKLSSLESFALPVLEMFATGGTAVVSAFDGHDAYIRDGYNALIVPIDDRDAAVRALRRLCDDAALRGRLSSGAAETCEQFSWERSSSLFEQELTHLCANAAPGLKSPRERNKLFRHWQPVRLALRSMLDFKQTLNRAKAQSGTAKSNANGSA